MKKLLTIIFLFLITACGKDDSGIESHVLINKTQTQSNLNMLLKSTTKVSVDVIYEAGAEPYIGNNFRNKPYWSVLETNMKAIYDARGMDVEIVVPTQLSDMTLIDIQNKDSWTAEQISSLANQYKKIPSSSTQAALQAVFVKGYFNNGSEVNQNVIGINVTGTTIIAIFKDVIKRMNDNKDSATAKFTEQSTLVHEFGHAIGLVNNGVKQISSHQDPEHGAHCNNPDCVMYWQNEGAAEMYDYIAKYLTSGSEVMYDEKCIEDLSGY